MERHFEEIAVAKGAAGTQIAIQPIYRLTDQFNGLDDWMAKQDSIFVFDQALNRHNLLSQLAA